MLVHFNLKNLSNLTNPYFIVVALIHALLTHPSLIQKVVPRRRIIDRILLIVPVNTLENWKAEFSKWIVNLPNLCLFDFSSSGKKGRETLANRWVEKGGVMLITHDTLARAVKKGNGTNFHRIFQAPGPDGMTSHLCSFYYCSHSHLSITN